MLIEKAEIMVKEGHEDAFHDIIRQRGIPLLSAIPGVKWVRFGRGVEQPRTFLFLIEWESLEAHGAFSSHPTHSEFLGLFAEHSEGGSMVHFNVD